MFSEVAYGYKLLWVVVWANIMAMLIQLMSAKLGIATGKKRRTDKFRQIGGHGDNFRLHPIEPHRRPGEAVTNKLMSAKLGIATGKNLAEHIRDRFPRPAVWFYWVLAMMLAHTTTHSNL
jgi:manganese transport protein